MARRPRTTRIGSLIAYLAQDPRPIPWATLTPLFGAAAIESATASGRIVRLAPSLYCSPAYAGNWETRARAALLWLPGAALAGTSALYAWRMVENPPSTVSVVVPHPLHVRPPEWAVVRRSVRALPMVDVGGLAVVEPAIAVCQGFAELSEHARSAAIYDGIRDGVLTADALGEALDVLPRVRMRGRIEATLAGVRAGAESYLEERAVFTVFATEEFAEVRKQVTVRVDGHAYRLDLYDAEYRIAIELDGATHDVTRHRDVARDARLATIGVLTLRFTYADIVERPAWCRAVVRRARAARAPLAQAG